MKLLLSLLLFGLAASAQNPPESPFACNRTGLSPDARKRHFYDLSPKLRALHTSIRELPDGYEFEFPLNPATSRLVVEWVDGERACCPFFDVTVRWDREGGPLWLRLTGRAGVKDFIRNEFAKWF